MTDQPGTGASQSKVGWIVAAVALIAVVVLGALLVTSGDDDDETTAGEIVTEETLLFEPAASIGPNAFTAPVTVDPGICDTAALLRELESRPDAYREWAEVLEIPEESVPEYIEGLKPMVLEVDTNVLNHGLRDGQAYPRASTLQAGTAVLVDTEASAIVGGTPGSASSITEPPSSTTTPESASTSEAPSTTGVEESFPSTTGPATTLPEGGLPVTRCKCGNPLLPLDVEEFTPGTPDSSPTTGPPDTKPPTTGTTTTTPSSSSSSSSSVPDSSSSTSTPSSSSSSTPSSGSSSTQPPDSVSVPPDDFPVDPMD
jgi:hypothetical protein